MNPARLRLVRHGETLLLEVTCGCGEASSLDPLEPFGTCEGCGADLEPDAGEVLPMGTA